MIIPTYVSEQPIDKNTFFFTRPWVLLIENLLNNLNQGVGQQGFQISQVSSDPASVYPPTTGGQLLVLQNTFGQQGGIIAGTLVFDPFEQNGGPSLQPNGQLKVMLNDGNFHNVTNT